MRWKAIGAALVLFLAGVLSGAMGQRLLHSRVANAVASPPRPFPGGPPAPWTGQRMSFIERLTKDLELSPEQATEVDRLMKESQEHMRKLWEPIGPLAQEEMARSREAIAAVLTEEQRVKMEEMFKRHGPGRRGGGGSFRSGDKEGGWSGREGPDGRTDGNGPRPGPRGGDRPLLPPPDEGRPAPAPEAETP